GGGVGGKNCGGLPGGARRGRGSSPLARGRVLVALCLPRAGTAVARRALGWCFARLCRAVAGGRLGAPPLGHRSFGSRLGGLRLRRPAFGPRLPYPPP